MKELEKKLGQKDETTSDTQEEGDSTPDVSEESSDDNEDVSETAKFIQEASEEYFSNSNQLKPETVQKLKELPSEQLIDAYLELQKNATITRQDLSDADAKAILDSVGGESTVSFQVTM